MNHFWRGQEMKKKYSGRLAFGFAVLFCSASPAWAQLSSFAVLGGSTVTNTDTPTMINGNLGVSPGSAVTGFPPGIVTGGTIHVADTIAASAQTDLTTTYNNLANAPCNANLTGQDLGGKTLTPGVYCFSTSAQLTGALTLDGQGNPNAVFVFKIGSSLTTASAASVVLINSASPCGIFWQVSSSATLGTGTALQGSIVALSSATLNSGASVAGRVLARNGAVTLDNSSVTVCAGGPGGVGSGPIFPAAATSIPILSPALLLLLGLFLALAAALVMRKTV
jgi:hypothetical protein